MKCDIVRPKKQRGENKASLLFCIMEPLSDTYGKGSVDDEKDGNKRLANAKIVRTWAGWMDASADGVPCIMTGIRQRFRGKMR